MPHIINQKISGMGNIRKRTTNIKGKSYTFWEARYTTGYDPSTGKQIQRSITGKTQREVRERLKAALLEIEQGTYIEPCKLTVGEWLDTWLADYLGNLKVMTKQTYTIEVNKHLKPSLGAAKLEALDSHTIQKFYNRLSQEQQLSPKTIKNIHGILHSALQQALDNGYIRRNPTEACKLPKVTQPPWSPFRSRSSSKRLRVIHTTTYLPQHCLLVCDKVNCLVCLGTM